MYPSRSSKKGKQYQNPVPTLVNRPGSMGKILWQYLTVKEERVPVKPLGPFNTDISLYNKPPESGLRITWIGHSSIFMEIDGTRLLIDPVWYHRASPVSFIGPARFFKPPLSIEALPPIDAVLISHDHYDHLDRDAIKKLAARNVAFICPLAVGKILEKWGVPENRITELDWSIATRAGNCTITAVPARHFSGRSILNRNETLWVSYVIKGNKHNVFHGADSGWFEGFKQIGDTYGPFDLTLLEIGAYNENWAEIHMGPALATDAHLALRGKLLMPIHWGTFNLAIHSWREPIDRVQQYARDKSISLFLPEPGRPTEAGEINSRWWEK